MMARIPVIDPGSTQLSNPKISTQSASAEQTQTIGSGKGMEALGGAVEKSANYLYQKMDEARNYTEVAQAKLKMTRGMGELILKADIDVDPDTGKLRTGRKEDYASYDEVLKTLRQDVSKGFTNKETQERFLSSEYDLQTLVTKNAIQKKFMGNMINEGQATTIETTDSLANAYAVTGDKKILTQIETTLDGAMNKGFFDADKVSTLKKAALKDAQNKLFINDLNINPKLADERLKSNLYKFDVDEAEKARAHYERTLNKIQNDNEESVISSRINGKPLSENAILSLMNTGKIDPKFADSEIKIIRNPDANITTDQTTYMGIMDMIVSNKYKPSDILRAMTEAQANRKLSPSDADSLFYAKQQGRDSSVYMGYYLETHKPNPWWNAALQAIKTSAATIFGGYGAAIPMFNALIKKAQSSKATPEQMPGLAVQVIKEKTIEENPSIANLKDVPNAKYDKTGYKGLLEGNNEAEPQFTYQNGRIVPVKKKE